MLVSYELTALTEDNRPIHGHVVIKSEPTLTGGIQFTVAACQIACGDELICHCDEAGFLRFLDGPEPGEVIVTGADWALGPWANHGTGVWFLSADGDRYPEPSSGFGDKADYQELPPRMELSSVLAEQGPFHAVGMIALTLAG